MARKPLPQPPVQPPVTATERKTRSRATSAASVASAASKASADKETRDTSTTRSTKRSRSRTGAPTPSTGLVSLATSDFQSTPISGFNTDELEGEASQPHSRPASVAESDLQGYFEFAQLKKVLEDITIPDEPESPAGSHYSSKGSQVPQKHEEKIKMAPVTTVGVPRVQQRSAGYVCVRPETQERDGPGPCEQWASC